MLRTSVKNIKLIGLSCCVPKYYVLNKDIAFDKISEDDVKKIINSTGVQKRHVADRNVCSSDLCYHAAKKLLDDLSIASETLDAIIFISQTPDYLLPATSYIVHSKLKCKKSTVCFDVNLGCSGYVYGLWLAASLLNSNRFKRILLLVGDTISKIVSPSDHATLLLFGDAGSATLIESHESEDIIDFCFGSDGNGYDKLIVKPGLFRDLSIDNEQNKYDKIDGLQKDRITLFMNGPEIFTFTLTEIPPLIENLAENMDEIDAVVFHQANKFILNHLAKKAKIPFEKLIYSLHDYGNTSSASIPLSLVAGLRNRLLKRSLKLILIGFGVGYSWAGCRINIGPIYIPEVLFL